MIEREKIILSFDLDNTLINNKEGITNSFNYALRKFNYSEIERSKIESMIGIPLNDMFAEITDLDPSILSSAFREYYGSKGIYQSHLLPGVRKKLKELKKKKFIMGVITSKKQELAEKILEILKIKKYFDYILGETEERKELGKLDPKLRTILQDKYPGYKIIVIGDHPKDVLLSNNLNCPFIGVLMGHHSINQLKELKEGKGLVLNSIRELTLEKIYSLLE
ncbi:MAG: HAD family hydrolase [Candidatus Thorarchaeota archaeon]